MIRPPEGLRPRRHRSRAPRRQGAPAWPDPARECVERYRLNSLQWVRVRSAVNDDMVRLNPDVDVAVLFCSA